MSRSQLITNCTLLTHKCIKKQHNYPCQALHPKGLFLLWCSPVAVFIQVYARLKKVILVTFSFCRDQLTTLTVWTDTTRSNSDTTVLQCSALPDSLERSTYNPDLSKNIHDHQMSRMLILLVSLMLAIQGHAWPYLCSMQQTIPTHQWYNLPINIHMVHPTHQY